MPTSTFSWLHLTDLHYDLKGQDCLWPTLREPFLDSLAALHDRCGPWNAVLFTGDLVQSGETAQFEKMQAEVLDPLWEKLRELGSGDAVLLAVPGNHDLRRGGSRQAVRLCQGCSVFGMERFGDPPKIEPRRRWRSA